MHNLLTRSFRQLNTEHGFTLQAITPPDLTRFAQDLSTVENSHLQYLGIGNVVQLARPEFAEKLARALLARVRSIFEMALAEIEMWNKTSVSQIDAQLRERRRAFTRRVDAIQRIQEAAGGLDQRIGEIQEQDHDIIDIQAALQRQVQTLVDPAFVPTTPPSSRFDTLINH